MDWEKYKNIFDKNVQVNLKEFEEHNLYQLFNQIFNDGYFCGQSDREKEMIDLRRNEE